MPSGRQKYCFYAVTNGREVGVYTSWTQAGDSVLGFAQAKYKGFCTYSEAASAMVAAGYSDYSVFDGNNTYSKVEYEQDKGYQLHTAVSSKEKEMTQLKDSENTEKPETEHQLQIPTVYIDGSCVRNGSSSAQAGFGVFWGIEHPWNYSQSLSDDSAVTNNKAELSAAVKALQTARDNNLEQLVICSDSNYVVQGITEWIHKWRENQWKTAGGDIVKNKEIWTELYNLTQSVQTRITWKHVPAHSGIAGNEEADKLALKAAKQVTDFVNRASVQATEKSNNATRSTDNSTVTQSQPRVIVIQKNEVPVSTTTKTVTINTTPKRIVAKDRSETQVPGCMNGASVNVKRKSSHSEASEQAKSETNTVTNKNLDAEHTLKIMNNIETVLQSVVAEIHEMRQEQQALKKDITGQIGEIQDKQLNVEKSVSSLSKKLSESINTCISKVENMKQMSPRTQETNDVQVALKSEISILQKKIDTRFDSVKSSIQTYDTTLATVRTCVKKISDACNAEFRTIDEKNNKLQDSVSEISNGIKRTRNCLTEVEKSLTTLSESPIFTEPIKSANDRKAEGVNTTLTDNRFSKLHGENDDAEVFFNATEQDNSTESSGMQAHDRSSSTASGESSGNIFHTSESESTLKTSTNNGTTEHHKPLTRKDMVYLLGDSISGHVNPAILGKSTNTYVKKLKAPKLEDLHALSNQVTDAKVGIIHTGINNLREKKPTDDRVRTLIEAVTSFREVAPDSKVVVSKVIPVGEHEIDIDRVIFNAEVEKRLTEINKSDIRFLDHANLSEHGVLIHEYYRQDRLHLSGQGIAVFAENLEKEIRHILKKDSIQDNVRMSTSTHTTNQHGFRRDNRREQYSNRGRQQGPSGMHNASNGHSAYRRDVRRENQRDKYIDGDRRLYRPIRPQTGRFYQSSYPDRREENTQRYRNSDDRSGKYSNKDSRMPYYRTDFSGDRNDTYYKAQSDSDSRHYSGERFDERELSYLRNRHFDRDYYDDDYYYHRHRGDIY